VPDIGRPERRSGQPVDEYENSREKTSVRANESTPKTGGTRVAAADVGGVLRDAMRGKRAQGGRTRSSANEGEWVV